MNDSQRSSETETVRYLSDEWFVRADNAVADLPPVGGELVVGFRVFVDPTTTVEYQTRFGPDAVKIERGHLDAVVVFSLGWDLAVAIANGTVSPQRAFLDGEITLGGDPGHLLGFQQELAAVEDRLAKLRHRTDYSRPDGGRAGGTKTIDE